MSKRGRPPVFCKHQTQFSNCELCRSERKCKHSPYRSSQIRKRKRDETSVQIEILNHSEIPSSKSIEHFEQEPSVAIEAFWEQSGNWRCELADISSPAGSLIELVLG